MPPPGTPAPIGWNGTDAQGCPTNVALAESSGKPALDRATLETLAAWRLLPAMHDGQAVASVILVPIRFELRQAFTESGGADIRLS